MATLERIETPNRAVLGQAVHELEDNCERKAGEGHALDFHLTACSVETCQTRTVTRCFRLPCRQSLISRDNSACFPPLLPAGRGPGRVFFEGTDRCHLLGAASAELRSIHGNAP